MAVLCIEKVKVFFMDDTAICHFCGFGSVSANAMDDCESAGIFKSYALHSQLLSAANGYTFR